MEDEEALEAGAVVSQLPDPVQHQVDNLLADSVVSASVVVGCVLLARDHLLGMEELPVRPGPDLVNDGGLEVKEDCPGHMLAGTSLGEESRERVILRLSSFDTRELSIGLRWKELSKSNTKA